MWLVFLLSTHAAAQLPLDPPVARRPANFSQLTGRFNMAAIVEPTQAIVEDTITLRVVIKGDVIRGEPPTRPHLRIFPSDFTESFYVEALSARDNANPSEKTWEFFWRL